MISKAFDFLFTMEWYRPSSARSQRELDKLLINQYKISAAKLFMIRAVYFIYLVVFTLLTYSFVYISLRNNFNFTEEEVSVLAVAAAALISAVTIVLIPILLTALFFSLIKKLKII